MWNNFGTHILAADDHMYVHGKMYSKDGNEPYYYIGAPETDDQLDFVTHFFPSMNKFIVYNKGTVIRIIFTSTTRSYDYISYTFHEGMLTKIYEQRNNNQCEMHVSNNVITDINHKGLLFLAFFVGDEMDISFENVLYAKTGQIENKWSN